MKDTTLLKLSKLQKANGGKRCWSNRNVFDLPLNPDIYILAYEKIKSNPGNMTPGTSDETLDGMSLSFINSIISQMKEGNFEFQRVGRVHIPKADGRQRPLGIPNPRDKIVQQAIYFILEAIYESPKGPSFSDLSHGFRRNSGCHTALKCVRKWSHPLWVIEGDIVSFYDTIDQNILLSLLSKRIKDERFLLLIRKTLRAGYLEFNRPINNLLGTPQGSILSPILANIYLNELDLLMESVEKRYPKTKRKPNLEYKRVAAKISSRENRMKQ